MKRSTAIPLLALLTLCDGFQNPSGVTLRKSCSALRRRRVGGCDASVYLDISVAGSELGRLVFRLAEDVLPMHVENFRALAASEKVGIEPKATFVGCRFEHSPMYVEGAQYKWAHVLKGNGRNAVGRPQETISDPVGLKTCVHDAFGGPYYGLEFDEDDPSIEDGVALVVPVMGPGRGGSRFNIVRVGDSPPSWGKRLLLNQAVIGTLESGGEVLRAMARQKDGPPTIIASGVVQGQEEEEEEEEEAPEEAE
jgi:hypothetical protein